MAAPLTSSQSTSNPLPLASSSPSGARVLPLPMADGADTGPGVRLQTANATSYEGHRR